MPAAEQIKITIPKGDVKMKKESTYHEMSYLEKRRKDKEFGKFCKSVMKHIKYKN